jgi:hypothetical protein
MEERKNNLEVGKSYPAVLIDVRIVHDSIKDAYAVEFVYKAYLSLEQTETVIDTLYWWDLPNFKNFTIRDINKLMEVYNLNLIPKDYRNEISFVNACKWLIGTRVELSPYRYKNIRYKIVSTERNNHKKINFLWKCLSNNNLSMFTKLLFEEWL